MKFVKASDRLPGNLKQWYIVRQSNNSRSAKPVWWEHIHGNVEGNLKLTLPNIEWLDESPPVVQTEGKELQLLKDILNYNGGMVEYYRQHNYREMYAIWEQIYKSIVPVVSSAASSPVQSDADGWISVEYKQPDCKEVNTIIECSEEVQIFDEALGVKQGWLKRYLVDSNDPLYPKRKKGYWVYENSNSTFHHVTHWQLLPKTPTIHQK